MINKLKKIREEKNMTQDELAEKSGVSRTIISQIENNKIINITKDTMERLAVNGLDSTIVDVFFD